MNNELSINADRNEIPLNTNSSDIAVVALKSAVSFVPSIGSILGEIVGVVIPNQKVDRIKLFAEVLDIKLKDIEKVILETKIKTEEFTDLFEDALVQASRSLTDERREYIANFLKVSLTEDELNHLGEKKLLSLLGQINDSEIILLKFSSFYEGHLKERFFEEHQKVLETPYVSLQSNRTEWSKHTIHKSFKRNLIDLGLLEPVYKKIKKGEVPEFDEKTGSLKVSYTKTTGLGRVLLKYIDETFVDENFPE